MGFFGTAKTRMGVFWNNPAAVTVLVIVPLLLSIAFSLLFPVSAGFPKNKRPVSLVYLSGNSIIHSGFEIILSDIPEEEYSITRVFIKSDGMDLLESGYADIFVLFNTGRAAFEIYHSSAAAESAARVESTIDAFLDYFRLNAIGAGTAGMIGYQSSLDRNGIRYQKIKPFNSPDSISYYSALFLIISLFYGAYFQAGKTIRDNRVLLRLTAAGKSRTSIWAGITAGNFAAVFLQGIIIFSAGRLILGMSTGNSLPVTILLLFTLAFFSVNLATLLCFAARSRLISEFATHLVLLFFSASGAGFLMYGSSSVPEKLKYLSPVYWLNSWMLELPEHMPFYIYILYFSAFLASGTTFLFFSRHLFKKRAEELLPL